MSVSELGPYHARSGIDRFLHPRRYGGPNYAAFDVANCVEIKQLSRHLVDGVEEKRLEI